MTQPSVKERMIKRPANAATKPLGVSPERAIRLGVSRAFEEELGWRIGVIGVGLSVTPFDETLAQFAPDFLTYELRSEAMAGFVAVDGDTRSAIIEVLTCHSAMARRASPRDVTAVDAALVRATFERLLGNLAEHALGTELEGWLKDVSLGGQILHEGQLEARLAVQDYRVAQVSLDFGVGDRQGQLVLAIALPPKVEAQSPEAAPRGIGDLLAKRLRQEPVVIEAVLHRFNMTNADISAWVAGYEIPLDGADLGRVAIVAAGAERLLGNARLGQIHGMKAIRLEPAAAPILGPLDIDPRKSEGPPQVVARTQSKEQDDVISLPQDP